MVTTKTLIIMVVVVGVWCGGTVTAALVLALLNRRE